MLERKAASEVTKQEALKIVREAEEDGLVHFVDNALGGIKSSCNCCSCCCWALGTIKRRRAPRDTVIATYFIRETDEAECLACGTCVTVCPVDALTRDNDILTVDEDWCVGCGLCVVQCPASAAKLRAKSEGTPPQDFTTLHRKILEERGLR